MKVDDDDPCIRISAVSAVIVRLWHKGNGGDCTVHLK